MSATGRNSFTLLQVECHPSKESLIGFGTDDGHVGVYNVASGKYDIFVFLNIDFDTTFIRRTKGPEKLSVFLRDKNTLLMELCSSFNRKLDASRVRHKLFFRFQKPSSWLVTVRDRTVKTCT